ncbi:uncharacterized protein LTR77_010394 [Saxophila tyrrhenica]|uniref:Mediator of RNA polymerase II transcription subunit 18 n=1 Tax=Saxophila tyrrhenica TaxID=1690608 RepID=A0AAV9NZ43_9PEZI|nr:hypothetical protein LTR77_010394 [Saxophila tyrrhenica]
MQDLLLFSQVSPARHKQVLQILVGITAAQPAPFLEQHLVFEQLRLPPVSKKAPANQTTRRAYQHLTRQPLESNSWTLRKPEVPEPGVKQVITQSVSEVSLPEADLEKFRPGLEWYKFINQFYLQGHRFVQGNVVITISRVCPAETTDGDLLESEAPTTVNLPPLDPSGSYVIEACVRMEDGSTTALRDQATKELLAFADGLKGAIDLRVPDRLALDPRIKGA